ncbi:MAG: helix-turn-helix domain-containing protein [Sphingopyxis sp.]|nr:helix-turn-helix domain-containing protein [Sphingopyxis sp.]
MNLLTYTGCTGAELATRLGVPAPLVSQWRTGARSIPVERCPSIERETGGAVTCEEMRPDVAWKRVKDRKWPHPEGRPLLDFTEAAA